MKTLIGQSLFLTMLLLCGAQIHADNDVRKISVSAEAMVKVAPDEIILTIGLESTDPNLTEAKHNNDLLTQKTIGICTNHDIPKKYIQTDYLNIAPVYDYYAKPREFLYYQVRKTAIVTIKNIEIIEKLLSDLVEAGIENIISIDFRTTDLRSLRDQARSAALIAAREKAEAMAGVLNQTIGDVLTINENRTWSWSWSGSSWYGRGNSDMSQNVIQNAGGPEYDGESLAPGQIAVKASVSVIFALQ